MHYGSLFPTYTHLPQKGLHLHNLSTHLVLVRGHRAHLLHVFKSFLNQVKACSA